jgi:hypothetical protein
MNELQNLKEAIEDGDSCIEAYEQVDLVLMEQEGDVDTADKIRMVLLLTEEINRAAGIE